MDTYAASVFLKTGISIAPTLAKQLKKLIWQVNRGACNEILLSSLQKMEPGLGGLGIGENMLCALRQGLASDQWDDAVEQFGRMKYMPFNFYLGPMRTRERDNSEMGMILLARSMQADSVVEPIEKNAERIGRGLFGWDNGFGGREVEFYDVVLAAGPLATPQPSRVHIALFAPFYFGGWHDVERQMEYKRTIILHNVIESRFFALTLPVAKCHVRIDGRSPVFEQTDLQRISRALITWITLHELMHNNGPLPLFAPPFFKLDMQLDYAGLEEVRVDLAAWLALGQNVSGFGSIAQLVRKLIVCERLARSFRLGFRPDFRHPRRVCETADGESGTFWLSLLHTGGALRFTEPGVIDVSMKKAGEIIADTAADIYRREEQACELADVRQHLSETVMDIRKRLFDRQNEQLLPADPLLGFFQATSTYPTSLHYRFDC